MKFEDQANTTATRMKRSAEAAYRRSDLPRLTELLEKAKDYKERLNLRRLNARNTTHYHLGYENDAANASWLVDIVEGLVRRLSVEEERYVEAPSHCGHRFLPIEEYRNLRAVRAACPWAEDIERVEGGWGVFDAHDSYATWKGQM